MSILPSRLSFLQYQLPILLLKSTPLIHPTPHLLPRLGSMHIHSRHNPSNIQRTTKTRQISKTLQSATLARHYAMFTIRRPKTHSSSRTPPLRFQQLMRKRRLPRMNNSMHTRRLCKSRTRRRISPSCRSKSNDPVKSRFIII
jgi:hypothetical protein